MPRIIAWYTKCSKWNESSQKLWSTICGWKHFLDFINPAKYILINKTFLNCTWQNHISILHTVGYQQVLANWLIVLRDWNKSVFWSPKRYVLIFLVRLMPCVYIYSWVFECIWFSSHQYLVITTPYPESNNGRRHKTQISSLGFSRECSYYQCTHNCNFSS